MTRPVFRFAPSPNGLLHAGHALSAWLNHDFARTTEGRFLLRIEDIDPTRTTAAYEHAILEDLEWLGLDWERPVLRQSERLQEYAADLERLRLRSLVYPCFCSRGEVRSVVIARGPDWPRDPDGVPLYPGTCRGLPAGEQAHRLHAGQPHVWRLAMERALDARSGPLSWLEAEQEGVLTEIPADPGVWGDVVLARRDVATSYHLAVVHDDAAQGVTHVVRGRDLYCATAIHRLLQDLLDLPAPIYRHHRLVMGEDGRKLSKSTGAPSLRDLRAAGSSPADIRRLVGLS